MSSHLSSPSEILQLDLEEEEEEEEGVDEEFFLTLQRLPQDFSAIMK